MQNHLPYLALISDVHPYFCYIHLNMINIFSSLKIPIQSIQYCQIGIHFDFTSIIRYCHKNQGIFQKKGTVNDFISTRPRYATWVGPES